MAIYLESHPENYTTNLYAIDYKCVDSQKSIFTDDSINKVHCGITIIEVNGKKSEPGFFNLEVKLIFAKLRLAFNKAPIFYCFDLESHIWIETDALSYFINGILNPLTLDNLG